MSPGEVGRERVEGQFQRRLDGMKGMLTIHAVDFFVGTTPKKSWGGVVDHRQVFVGHRCVDETSICNENKC